MRRYFLSGLLTLWITLIALPVDAQEVAPQRVPIQPPEVLFTEPPSHPLYVIGQDWSGVVGTLTESQILQRFSEVYQLQAELLTAQARQDQDEASKLLGQALDQIATLAQQPGMVQDTRFRELYRTLVTEYEGMYGPNDTLYIPTGEIFAFRADMFAALNAVEDPLLESIQTLEIQPLPTTVPMTMNRLVESSIAFLLKNPDRNVNHWMRRAETYFPMIERIFAEEGVPDELKYLALVESGLNPRARSWAKAVGMWQFIAATGRAYGLEAGSWVDERMDPEKATRAAARHLRDLYNIHGDWHLALANYNCSPRCINRGKRRAREKGIENPTFWDIYPYIPRETRNYVPMYIAASLIVSNPTAFGLQPPTTPSPRYAYHYMPVQGMIALEDIATMAGTDEATIRALNPELRRNTLPPSNGAYYVRIPLGTYDTFLAAYAANPPRQRRAASDYRVRRGDTLSKIARQYGVSVADLKQRNGLRSNTIRVGQRLVVPVETYDGDAPLMVLADTERRTIEYSSYIRRPIAATRPANVAVASNTTPPVRTASNRTTTSSSSSERSSVTYRVRRGDTLGKIAARYGVTVSQLRNWNGIRGSRINVGRRLTVYGDNPNRSTAATSSSSSSQTQVTYRVRRGDNLNNIAKKYGVSVSDIQGWNNLRGTRINAGQRLTIYTNGGSSSSESRVVTYRVRRGDTLGKIASRYGVTVSKLQQWNSLSSSRIRAGQRLKIYQ